MNLIIDFYKDLDTINLIIFWGIILVILLLLIFSIIIVNKNKRLRRIIIDKSKEIEESKSELAIKQDIIDKKETNIYNVENKEVYVPPVKEENITKEEITINNNDVYFSPPVKEETENHNIEENNIDVDINIENDTEEEEDIDIKEEDYNKEVINVKEQEEIPIKKEVIITEEEMPTKEEFIVEEHIKPKKEIVLPTGPYQRNVLREMSLNQTSPIGITKKEINPQKEILNKEVSHTTINNIEIIEDTLPTETYKNNYKEEMNNSKKMINELYETNQKVEKENNYLKELSKKIEESADEIERTAYEIKQEEDAIISYDELMRKKDSLKIEDDEDAIISIEELKKRKMEEEKIYNITKEEENEEFISELKEFRSDL